MYTLKNLSFLFLLTALVLSSCVKEPIEPDPIKIIPEVLINASLNGTVIDESRIPIENAIIRSGSNTTESDINGVFSFNNIQVNQNGAKISIEKEGYFNNTKVVFTKSNKTSISNILLIEKKVTSTFTASTGGTSTMNGGATVSIPAEGVKLEDGTIYSGDVAVYATWLDPTADDLNLRMPGDLRASNSDDEAVKLVTYGMMGVELEGVNGEALNIADGQSATIEFPVPASLLSSAPATIPLWHFDEATGYWIEEGEATLTGNKYVGTVSHFSFWNVDVPYDFIHINGTITDQDQAAISDLAIQISMNSNGETAYGYTDFDGVYEGYVPKDETLTMKVLDICGMEIYVEEIGPFSDDSNIPTIVISNSSANFLTVYGMLQDCNNEVETNGYVYVNIEGSWNNYIDVDSDGNFNGTISVCDQMEIMVSGVSLDPFSQGTSTVHDIEGVTELNVGTLVTCW